MVKCHKTFICHPILFRAFDLRTISPRIFFLCENTTSMNSRISCEFNRKMNGTILYVFFRSSVRFYFLFGHSVSICVSFVCQNIARLGFIIKTISMPRIFQLQHISFNYLQATSLLLLLLLLFFNVSTKTLNAYFYIGCCGKRDDKLYFDEK